MTKTLTSILLLTVAMVISLAVSAETSSNEKSAIPATISKAEIAGKIFERSDTIKLTEDGVNTLDVTSFISSDKKFGSGMWKTGKLHFVQTKPWGVDEFIYIVDGSLTVTSADGTVQVLNAGDAMTIPKEWTGKWDSPGFTQIWVIYTEDGSGLE
jgi:uncharacterized cupin superfamily protein